ncbi:MAG TPA: HAMP domain-containing sensor histidine kinase [Candidatus Paceibacterota bacterium]
MFFDVFYYNATGNLNVIRFNHLYVLPFLFSASYVLLRHHFLNVKVLATELFTILIIGISIVQLTFVRTATEFLFSTTLFILLVIFSFLLIRSMNREVRHRAREAAYEELQKLDAAKSEFITIASHQLRTPLSGLKGYVSMAQEGSYGQLPEEMLRVLGNMGQATERLISLADSFLNVSRMQAGSIELNRQETNMVPFLESIVEEMMLRVEKKKLKIKWNPPVENLPKISIDQEKIRTVLLGVLDNAIRYTKEGSITVCLKAKKNRPAHRSLGEGGGVVISVADTGKGLTQEELQDVFTSFKRGKTAQALWTEGVGLSLFTAKQFVEAHAGRIWAESKGTGQGSTFFVELPIASAFTNRKKIK